MNLLWLQIGLLVGLSGFLLWTHLQRLRVRTRHRALRQIGHGFEATELKARLGDLRERHQQIPAQHRRQTVAHEAFVLSLRKSLLRLSFFRASQEPETSSSDHNNDPQSRTA